MNSLFIVFLVVIWHYMAFMMLIYPERSFFFKENFDLDEQMILKKEKFYERFLKIKVWKDKIPQYVMENGFSKKKLSSLNIGYLKDFISETYRSEINHFVACMVILPLFFLTTLKMFFIFSIVILIGNLPCVLIQRYNRLRIRRIIFKIENRNHTDSHKH